jgi:alkyl sulfatase BDS1-like metallo-beta-lactamase superfamily hydrolase
VRNGALSHRPNTQDKDADATVTMTRAALNQIVLGETSLDKEISSGNVKVQGQKEALGQFLAMLDKFEFWFNIVTP